MIKYIYIAAITLIFFSYLMIPSLGLGTSLVMALFVTLVLYFAGDRFLLPRFGALATAIGNFILAVLAFSVSNLFVREPLATAAVFAAAAVIGVVEWFYFRYVRGATIGATTAGENLFPFTDENISSARDEGETGQENDSGPGSEQGNHQPEKNQHEHQ